MNEIIRCCACEVKKPHSELDPDFCQECYDKSESKDIMYRAHAYSAYADTYGFDNKRRKQFEFLAFMDLFHPLMPISKRLKLSKELIS